MYNRPRNIKDDAHVSFLVAKYTKYFHTPVRYRCYYSQAVEEAVLIHRYRSAEYESQEQKDLLEQIGLLNVIPF